MRKFVLLVLGLLAFGALASAQLEPEKIVPPRSEIYLGYAYQHADTKGSNVVNGVQLVDIKNTNLNGFDFQVSHYFKSGKLGWTVDIDRTTNSRVNNTGIKETRTSYLGGPTYRIHQVGFVTFNVHALAGVDHDEWTITEGSFNYIPKDTSLAVLGGVTADGNLSKHLAVRLGQVDFQYTGHNSNNQFSIRYTGGVVLRF